MSQIKNIADNVKISAANFLKRKCFNLTLPVADVCVEEEERLCDGPAPHGGRHVQRSLPTLVHRARYSAGPDQAAKREGRHIMGSSRQDKM